MPRDKQTWRPEIWAGWRRTLNSIYEAEGRNLEQEGHFKNMLEFDKENP
jgi:hypothetical protein